MSGLKTRRDLLSTALRSGVGMATAASIPVWLPVTALGSGEGSRFRLSIPAGAEQLGIVPFDVEWRDSRCGLARTNTATFKCYESVDRWF